MLKLQPTYAAAYAAERNNGGSLFLGAPKTGVEASSSSSFSMMMANPTTTTATTTTTNTTTTMMMTASKPVNWRTLLDNVVVELLGALFVNLTTILCWTSGTSDMLQFMPSVVLGLVLLCIKDEDYFFPDSTPTISFVLWVLGGYTWIHLVARVLGQLIGFGIALWICLFATLPPLEYRFEQGLTVVFFLELIGTTIEHMAVVYVILPLLPPAHSHHQSHGDAPPSSSVYSLMIGAARVKPKSHQDTQPPSNTTVMHAAIVFAGLHWCLSRGFCIEMNPMVTLLVAILRSEQHPSHTSALWAVATIALWAQALGVLLCITYVSLFAPRETKFWLLASSSSRPKPAF